MVVNAAGDIFESNNFVADSLKNVLKTQSLTDRQKSNIYGSILDWYAGSAIDSIITYAPAALHFAKKTGDKERILINYSHLGVAYCFRKYYDKGFACFDTIREIAVKTGDKQREATAYSFMGFGCAEQGKYLTAIDYYTKALAILESVKQNDSQYYERLTGVLVSLAEMNRKLSNLDVAIQYLDIAFDACNKILNGSKLSQGWYTWKMGEVYNEYAFNYLEQNNLDKAKEYAQKADSINDYAIINKCYSKGLLAKIYLSEGDYKKAIQYANEALKQADRLNDKPLHVNTGMVFSDIYMAQKRYMEAETAALKVWQTDSTDIKNAQSAALNIALANIYMHNTEKAADFLKKYSVLNTQYAKKSFQTTVSDLAAKYETKKKEIRISSLERQKILFIIIGIIAVLLAIGVGIVSRQKIKREQLQKQLIATDAVLEWEEKERKRFASELHDSINGILSALKIELNSTKLPVQNFSAKLDECIETIRRMAAGLMPPSLERFGMKAALEDYCSQFPNVRFHFYGEDKRIDKRIELVVYYCACELVNNSFKHSGAENVNVQLVQDEKYVSLTVQDDGCGFDKENVTQGSGLKNIRNRVTSCNGKLDISSSPGAGTETVIELRV